jgi:hypothetical protein
MSTTTQYGEWGNVGRYRNILDDVREALGDFAEDYDIEALTEAYRDAINTELPEGVVLRGNTFYGPYPRVAVDLASAVKATSLWELTELHLK